MSAMVGHSNLAHQNTVNLSESTRQTAVAAAIAAGGGDTVVRAAIKAAEIAHYRACVASCVSNGNLQSGVFRRALQELGTGGI